MRGPGRSDFSPELLHALVRPAFQVLLLNVQEPILREAEARLLKDLKLPLDERSLGVIQRRIPLHLHLAAPIETAKLTVSSRYADGM